jgi:hypothetical protein
MNLCRFQRRFMAVLHKINPVSVSALKTKSPYRCGNQHDEGIRQKNPLPIILSDAPVWVIEASLP